MSKIFKKITCIILAVLSVFVYGGCIRRGGTEIDDSKMQLWVGIYDAGGGTEWLKKVINRFESDYADYTFSNGKKGIEVHIDPSRNYSSETMDKRIESLNGEVIFAEGSPAVYMSNSGYVLDINDLVTSDIGTNYITGENKVAGYTIAEMLSKQQNEFLLANKDAHYYTLPTNETYFSIIYDRDLFDQEKLYFNNSGNLICDDGTNTNTNLSNGADGKAETAGDNGLPATYEQFFKLCDKLAALDMLPITWGGTVSDYVSSYQLCMVADYQGVEQTRLNYDYSGMMTDYISGFSGGNPVLNTSDLEINVDNGFELYKQTGRYHALKFLEKLLKTSTVKGGTTTEKYVDKSEIYSTAFTHTAAQTRFVSSKNSTTKKRVAMLIDGTWWQNEAKKALVDSEGSEVAARARNFGVMPIPKVDSSKLGDQTLLQLTGHSAMIKKSVSAETLPIAKEFLKYCFTTESLVEYTQTTAMVRPYNFEMTPQQYNGLTGWGKNLFDLHQTANKVYQDSSSEIAKFYSSDLWHSKNLWNATINGNGYTFPSTALKYGSVVNAESYFNGMQSYWTRETWRSKFSYVVTP